MVTDVWMWEDWRLDVGNASIHWLFLSVCSFEPAQTIAAMTQVLFRFIKHMIDNIDTILKRLPGLKS